MNQFVHLRYKVRKNNFIINDKCVIGKTMLTRIINKKIVTALLILTSMFAISTIYLSSINNGKFSGLLSEVVVTPAIKVQSVNLVDHNNDIVNIERLNKRWTFVFFGYTNCPDVCPATIAQLKVIKRGIKNNTNHMDKTQFFFVSVDPQRDTSDILSRYMKYFDPSFIGMTGSKKSIQYLEQQLGSFHRIGNKNSDGDYSVQHSAEIFLIDSDARLVAKFQPPMNTDKIVRQFNKLVSLHS